MGRLWPGLRARVILTYLVIFVVSTVILAGRAGAVFSQVALNGAERDMEVQAYLMASALERPWFVRDGEEGGVLTVPQPQLQTLAGSFAQGGSGQLTILDIRGNPLAYSTPSEPNNQMKAPEVSAALKGWLQHDVRYDPMSGQRMIFAAAPIQRSGHVLGIVQVATPLAQVRARTRSYWLNLGATALLAALAAAVAGWWLAGQLVGPVRRLRDAATRLAAGDLDERVPDADTGGVAEIGQLATAFNHMAGRIGDMINRERAFVANASHELRTPLTNIKLRAEALNNGALDDPVVARRFVGEIESEADRLGKMAGDLLSLSRHDAAAPAFREPLDPGVLIRDVTREMSLRAEKNGVRIVQDLEDGLPCITGDPVGLHTVLSNLVDNALKYTPGGGTVTLAARLMNGPANGAGALVAGRANGHHPAVASEQAEDEIRGSGRPALIAGRSVLFTVSDTGAGIPPEDLPHVFERFYRADKARSRRLAQIGSGQGSGAGLGLAIVRGIVEEHGGAVTAESVMGQGTTIRFVLPVPADGPSTTRSPHHA